MDSCGYEIGDYVYASDWCYGQIVDIYEDSVRVEFETFNGGGSMLFGYDEIYLAGDVERSMTNYEKLVSDKRFLAKFLSREEAFYVEMDRWYCPSRCPHAKECRDECIDNHTTKDLIMMWFDEEYKEDPNE